MREILNEKEFSIQIDQAQPTLPREYMSQGLANEVVKAYYEFMVDIAVILGADKGRVIKELGEVLEFEIQLAHVRYFVQIFMRVFIFK